MSSVAALIASGALTMIRQSGGQIAEAFDPSALLPVTPKGKNRGYTPARDPRRGHHTSIAKANRWTGRPHEHKREIARRLRTA